MAVVCVTWGCESRAKRLAAQCLVAEFAVYCLPFLRAYGHSTTSLILIVSLLVAVNCVGQILAVGSHRGTRFNVPKVGDIGCVLLLPMVAYLLASSIPLFGWDVLTAWAPYADGLIESEFNMAIAGLPVGWRHSYANATVLASLSIDAFLDGSQRSVAAAWLTTYLALAMVAGCVVFSLTKRATVTVLAMVLLTSIPLLENHALIYGYTELKLSFFSMSLMWVFVDLHQKMSGSAIILGFLAIAGAGLTRNTGIFYAAVIITAGATPWLVSCFSLSSQLTLKRVCGLTILLSTASVILAAVKESTFNVAGKTLTLNVSKLSQSLLSEFVALFVNSSFNLTFLGFLFCVVHWAKIESKSVRDSEAFIAAQVLLMASMYLTVSMMFSLLSEYGLQHALPGADTGNSRFHLPVVSIALVATVCYVTINVLNCQTNHE